MEINHPKLTVLHRWAHSKRLTSNQPNRRLRKSATRGKFGKSRLILHPATSQTHTHTHKQHHQINSSSNNQASPPAHADLASYISLRGSRISEMAALIKASGRCKLQIVWRLSAPDNLRLCGRKCQLHKQIRDTRLIQAQIKEQGEKKLFNNFN